MKPIPITSLKLPLLASALALSGIMLSGCGSMGIRNAHATDASASQNVLQQKDAEIATLKNSLSEIQTTQGTTPTAGNYLLPPNAQPGQCFTRAFVPPTYQTDKVKVLKSDASERIEVIPARYAMTAERVLVKEASERIESKPAVYKTVTEQVLDKAEHTVWKKGTGPITKVDQSTGEIMCLVTVPATYKAITKQVLVSPATSHTASIPAEYTTIKKRVLKTPATTQTVEIPAEYRMVKTRVVAEPAKTTTVAIPASYETVTQQSKLTEGRIEWRPVLCQTNMTTDVSIRIQRALQSAGYNPCNIDGVIGRDTLQAIEAYQRTKGLPSGGLTLKTIESLGVEI